MRKELQIKKVKQNFSNLSIEKIFELYNTRKISPVDVAKMSVLQVERLEKEYRAWVCFDKHKLLLEARKAKRSLLDGVIKDLLGIPIGVKDIFNTIDFPTEMGSPIWRGFKPGNDSRVVYYLRQAGALIPGKTVTAEFAVHTPGATLNPHDKLRTPGTSSSGSAVAVSLGMVPVALGTQTAGSIVRPASYCGIWGFKPTFGLLPRTGVLKTTDSLDTVGFFVYHIEDVMRVFNVIRVKGQDYPISNSILNDKIRQDKPKNSPWRVAFVKTHLWKYLKPYVKNSLADWVSNLNKFPDIVVNEVDLPEIMKDSHYVHSLIYDKSLSYYFRDEFKKSSLVSNIMNNLIKHGNKISLQKFKGALKTQEEMAKKMDDFFGSFDILISASTAGIAPLTAETEPPDPCLIWTMTYLPALGAPIFKFDGLPFGAQIVARRYNDFLLLKFIKYLKLQGMVPPSANPIQAC